MRINILGKVWQIKRVARLKKPKDKPKHKTYGECDHPEALAKEIRVLKSLRGQELLEIYIHEMIHASGWHLDEEYVELFAADVARELWKLGYRNSLEEETHG